MARPRSDPERRSAVKGSSPRRRTRRHRLLAVLAICADPPVNGVDQRGMVRPQRVDCDIGSFELA